MPRGGAREGAGRKPGSVPREVLEKRKTLSEIARESTDEAIETLKSIMADKDQPASARAICANSLLDRGWGKAIERSEHGSPGEFDWMERATEQQLAVFIETGEVPVDPGKLN